MGSDKKNGDVGPLHEEKNKPTTKIPDELDLDKNPIKFATSVPGELTTEAHDKDYLELTLRHGKHSEIVQKILRQRIELRAKEFPRWPGEFTGGVRALWIESRFWYDRERLGPDFDDDWRSYRARYLHSLELDPREPVHVPEYEKSLINPIRRFYMKAGDFIEDKITSKFAKDRFNANVHRSLITRGFMVYLGLIGSYYWIRYHNRKWEEKKGPDLYITRPFVYPGDQRFPYKDPRTKPEHHCVAGFPNRTIFRDLRDYEDRTVVL